MKEKGGQKAAQAHMDFRVGPWPRGGPGVCNHSILLGNNFNLQKLQSMGAPPQILPKLTHLSRPVTNAILNYLKISKMPGRVAFACNPSICEWRRGI